MIHKIKWQQLLESFYILPNDCPDPFGFSLCNKSIIVYKNKTGSAKWRNVTCKNCLKQKKK